MKYSLGRSNHFFYQHMKKVIILFFAMSLVAVAESSVASNGYQAANIKSKYVRASTNQVIKGQYIVVLKNQYVDQQLSIMSGQVSVNSVTAMSYRRYIVENTAIEMASSHHASVNKHYHAALSGFTARMSTRDMQALLADNRVAFIEEDQVMRTNMTQTNVTWGLDRIDQENLPLDSLYTSNIDGSGVNAYIIDTGIYVSHSDFEGRAKYAWDFVGNDSVANDCNGHGTHVAGTIGSSTYGVAKNVTLHAVRVLGCRGSGSNSTVIAGIDWVARNAVFPAVANMSLGGGSSRALDNAVQNAINKGVTFVVAAGNSNSNACSGSPNRIPDALTVAASTSTDSRSSFSSWGSCVDVFAPGSSITSTWNNGSSRTLSGTSMSAPHAAGVVALYLQENPSANPATVNTAITSNAVGGKIRNPRSSPNLLLQANFDGSPPPTPPTPPTPTPTPPTPTPAKILEKAVAVTNLSGVMGSEASYTLEVPAEAVDLGFDIQGGVGDVDLYVKFGSPPTISSYDCRPRLNNNTENCNFSNPSTGTYYVMLRAFSDYSNVSLVGDYTMKDEGETDGSFFENPTDINIPDRSFRGVTSSINVLREGSAGIIEVAIDIKHTYIGNLHVQIFAPDGARATLHNRRGGSSDNLIKVYRLNAGSRPASGTWRLRVRDMARGHTGFIDSWSITFK